MITGRPQISVDARRAFELKRSGLSWSRIARELGVHRNTLLRVRQEFENCKRCGGPCKAVLPMDSFSLDRSRRDGRNLKCRQCVSDQWKENNSSPCIQCGGPRRSVTPGHCRRCYRLNALITNSEYEVLSIIPSIIAESHRELKSFIGALSNNRRLQPAERLRLLIERVSSGTTRTVTTQA